ncbi:galectin-8-like isoform X1 [Amphibalanus amphitrite]|uniref:galectin-8-like isoform X1 n=2 Tax=Amphibalanus amphitrite TaxID=1232801 RepID=UPI001C913DED|nr:galectin-8-like isoform X1 [Amphibalanus amphitrite]
MGLCCGRSCAECCRTERQRPLEYTGAAVLATATAPATTDQHGRTMLAMPYHECLPWKLSSLKCITVRGRVPERPFRWKVELLNGGIGDDIALHVDARHDLGHVVRNSRLSGAWGTEEICGQPAMPFTPGRPFELTIFCVDETYRLAVDGRHFATFRARSPPSRASTLHCTGTMELEAVGYADDVRVYPPRPAPALALAADGGGYLQTQPEFPCRLPEPIQDGGEIRLTGRVKMLPFSFFVDLRHGSQLYPEPEVILHFNPRFQVNNNFDIMVLNTKAAGWGREQRPEGFPFRAGRPFQLRFVCRPGSWEVLVDGALLVKYPHRLSKASLDAIDVRGDVVIESVFFQPNSKDLIQF